MVLEILADTGQIAENRNAERLQQAARSDARELKQLRALQRAGAEKHFALGLHTHPACSSAIFHAHGSASLEQHAGDAGAGFDA
jgi:hypothetical protein